MKAVAAGRPGFEWTRVYAAETPRDAAALKLGDEVGREGVGREAFPGDLWRIMMSGRKSVQSLDGYLEGRQRFLFCR